MLSGLVACKLDRSELGHLEALAAKLQKEEDFKMVNIYFTDNEFH